MCVLSCGEGIAVNPKGVCQSVVPPRPLVSEQLQMAANGCFMSATAKNGEGTVEVHRLRKYNKQTNKNLRCGNRKGLLGRNDQTHHTMVYGELLLKIDSAVRHLGGLVVHLRSSFCPRSFRSLTGSETMLRAETASCGLATAKNGELLLKIDSAVRHLGGLVVHLRSSFCPTLWEQSALDSA